MFKKSILLLGLYFTISCISFAMPHASYAFSSDFSKGANIRPASSDDFSSASFQQSLRNLSQDGANFVTLVIPWYQTNIYSTTMLHGNDTPTDTSVINAITYAHSLGLKVMLKPHIDPFSGEWRAMINPSDRATWFANYGNMLTHYAQIAQQQHVEAMCLGTELYTVTDPKVNPTNTDYWNTMIQNVRNNFSGKLTYDAQHSGQYSEVNDVTFWDKLDFIGISGYYPLSGSSVADYITSWDTINNQQIKPLYQKWGKPIWFTEVGYKSIAADNTNPGDWQKTGTIDTQGQANLYQALFSYWTNQPQLKGITFWEWTSNPNGGGANNNDYTPQNKPAESVIKQWYTQNGSTASVPVSISLPYAITAAVTPQNGNMGQQTTAAVTVSTNTGVSDGIVDVEIYNGSSKISQQFFDHQNINAGQQKTYTIAFTPTTAGAYQIKAGIFNSNWAGVLFWNDTTANFSIGNGTIQNNTVTITPTMQTINSSITTSPNQSISVWWPTDKAIATGVQPFKANVSNLSLGQYTMYWQVDGGTLNLMSDNQTNGPHKEADVNVSGWKWKGNGPYVITFIAKDLSGNTITSQSIHLSIGN